MLLMLLQLRTDQQLRALYVHESYPNHAACTRRNPFATHRRVQAGLQPIDRALSRPLAARKAHKGRYLALAASGVDTTIQTTSCNRYRCHRLACRDDSIETHLVKKLAAFANTG
jgi:hypothetical protein